MASVPAGEGEKPVAPAAPGAAPAPAPAAAPPPLRRTPLHACHLELGAKMVPFAGWEMPVQYAGLTVEHQAVRTAAGLFDVSHMGEIAVRGGGAARLLDRLTPNDVARLAPGRAHYSGLLTERGTYLDDLLIYRLAGDDFLVVVNASNARRDFDWIAEHARAGGDDCEVADLSDRYALLALQGPKALAILSGAAELDALPADAPRAGVEAPAAAAQAPPAPAASLAAIRYYSFRRGRVAGRPALISRTGYTGEDGFEIYLAAEDAPDAWRRLLAAGAGEGLTPAGLGARDTLRLEAAMALYGHEIDETTTPFEAGLDWVVKLDKGDFLGRQALLAQRTAGLARQLVGIAVLGRGIARQGHAVLSPRASAAPPLEPAAPPPRSAQSAPPPLQPAPPPPLERSPVGAVTSGTWSPTLGKAIALAYVPPQLSGAGTELAVDVRGKEIAAAVVALPFYRRERRS